MAKASTTLTLGPLGPLWIDSAGWAVWQPPDRLFPLWVRIAFDNNGRADLIELHLVEPLTATAIRDLPIGRLQAAINGPYAIRELREVLSDDGEPRRGANYNPMTGRMPRAAINAADFEDLALEIPGGPRPDSFYEQVAEVFARAAAMSISPAIDVAEANGVPVTTVHRWVKEARRRGVMSPASRTREEDQ